MSLRAYLTTAATAVAGFLASNIAMTRLRLFEMNALAAWATNFIKNVNISVTLTEAMGSESSIQISMKAANDVMVTSVLVMTCGIALGLKVCWKSSKIVDGIDLNPSMILDSDIMITEVLCNDLEKKIDPDLNRNQRPILSQYQSNVSPCRRFFSEESVEEKENRTSIQYKI